MHVRYFRYLGALLVLVPVAYLAMFGLASLAAPTNLVWIGCTLLAGVGFVVAGLDRYAASARLLLAGSYLLAAVATVANGFAPVVSGGWAAAEPFALFTVFMGLCFAYFAYAIGTDNGAFEVEFGS
ncbi:hypothetical protein [Haloarchaeobius amylolyticus]|uniref:hypothetical protein n=1 Tax=Haloarchaeobius amylolyticus TaxID=1198296 RepID=UPI00226F4915|nr:hypothetical protein [Haloarchaeobius amylolyticus]